MCECNAKNPGKPHKHCGLLYNTCDKLDYKSVSIAYIVISASEHQVKTIVCVIFVAFSVLSSDVAVQLINQIGFIAMSVILHAPTFYKPIA